MPFFIKKPIPIEAVQFTLETGLDLQNSSEGAINFVENTEGNDTPFLQILGPGVSIERVELGEWVLKDPVSGNFYPVTNDTFTQTYDEVPGEDGAASDPEPQPEGASPPIPATPAASVPTRKGKSPAPVADPVAP